MPEALRIAFATPEYVTEDHFDGGLANYINRIAKHIRTAIEKEVIPRDIADSPSVSAVSSVAALPR